MVTVYRFSLAFTIAIGLVFTVRTAQTFACTPPPTPQDGIYPAYTIADQVNGSDIVLEGTIIAVEDEHTPNVTAIVEVHQYLKGRGPAKVTINNFGSPSLCRTIVRRNLHGIFYATGNPSTGLQAYYYVPPHRPQLSSVATPDPQTIAEIMVAVGREPFVPVQASETVIPTVTQTSSATATPTTAKVSALAAPQTLEATVPSNTQTSGKNRQSELDVVRIAGGCMLLIILSVGVGIVGFVVRKTNN